MINLMIADDNIQYTEYLSCMLTKEKDIEVINISYEGISTIANYNNLRPDVLILDLDMPRYSGIEILEKIHKYTQVNNVIIVSGSDEWRARAHNASKYDWSFPKTVTPSQLIKTIRMIANANARIQIEDFLDSLLLRFLFDDTDSTEFVKIAILTLYDYPNIEWDNAMKIVASRKNMKSQKNTYQIIYRCVKKALDRHENNFSKFDNILTPSFKYSPTVKHFIEYMAKYLHKIYRQKEKYYKATS